MEQTQRSTQGDTTSVVMPNVIFREIHKNAFLKRHSSDRRTGFPRKSERVWVVFCVHDDSEAFLEIYSEQKLALTHKPEWFASLANALHVSPSICGHEDEFEFAVTLTSQVVRLAAPSWDLMMEWVDTIRNKLRELKVLSPKENLYSRMPEPKLPLLPTRDPNSPLPLPPQGPSTILPGVEPVHSDGPSEVTEAPRQQPVVRVNNEVGQAERRVSRQHTQPNISVSGLPRRGQEVDNVAVVEGPGVSQVNGQGAEVSMVTVSAGESATEGAGAKPRVRLNRAVSVPDSPVPHTSNLVASPTPDSNITVIEVPNSRGSHSASECGFFNFQINDEVIHVEGDVEDVFFTPPLTPKPKIVKAESNVTMVTTSDTHYEHVFFTPEPSTQEVKVRDSKSTHISNISITPTPKPADVVQAEPSSSVSKVVVPVFHHCGPSSSTQSEESSDPAETGLVPSISVKTQAKLEKVNTTGLIPRVPSKTSKHDAGKKVSVHSSSKDVNSSHQEPTTSSHNVEPSSSREVVEVKKPQSSSSTEIEERCQPSTSSPYSQVKKAPKPTDSVEVPNSQILSPVPARRRINEIKIHRSNSDRKPEVLPRTTSGKNPVLSEAAKPLSATKSSSEETCPKVQLKSGNSSRSEVSGEVAVSGPSNRVEMKHSAPVQNGRQKQDSACALSSSVSASVSDNRKETQSSNNNTDTEPLTASVQPTVGVINVQDIPLIGGHQRRRRRSSSSDAAPTVAAPAARGISGADRIRINLPLTGLPMREPNICHRSEAEQNTQVNLISQGSSRLTLREQQVLQLRKEMSHPGGVRLQLRRKDCVGSIALVDVLGGVWVAGWKQREHPMLYNALHIGDQLMSVSEVLIRSSADAQKLLRSSTNLYIEFIIRRVPFGKVFALRRSSEGQSLGIIQEGNTAEIKDIVPSSIAARQGLSAKTPTCDGLSLTNWYLTEINGRPLNLFFKDNEVKERLNSVGKEISILVQPHDFIKMIKKQLKGMRSYKEYIVQ